MSKQSQRGVEKVVERLNIVLRRELEHIHMHLIDSGLDQEKVDEAFGTYTPTKKYGIRNAKHGEISIITDYGTKTHAIFGDTTSLKDIIKDLSYINFNRNLSFGPGWLIRDKTKLDEIEEILKDKKIKIIKLSRKEYENNLKTGKYSEEDCRKIDKADKKIGK